MKNSVLVSIVLFLYRQHVTLSVLAQVALVATDDNGINLSSSLIQNVSHCVSLGDTFCVDNSMNELGAVLEFLLTTE